MKKILILILTVILTATVSGQTNEFSVQLSSGLFSFRGLSATKTSTIIFTQNSYTNNPYGRGSGLSYGFGLQVQRITRTNFIFGLQTSYESLSSKVKIDNGWALEAPSANISDGKTILTNQFLSFHPFLGERMKLFNQITSDLTLGIDLGVCLNSREHETGIVDNEGKYDDSYTLANKPSIDIRPRIEFTNYYKKFGLTIGYSYGLTNYTNRMVGANMEVFSRMIRFGLTYRL